MMGLVERRADEIVHPCVDHEPTAGTASLRLDHAAEENTVCADEGSTGLDVEG
jgi:hypothetical protein